MDWSLSLSLTSYHIVMDKIWNRLSSADTVNTYYLMQSNTKGLQKAALVNVLFLRLVSTLWQCLLLSLSCINASGIYLSLINWLIIFFVDL